MLAALVALAAILSFAPAVANNFVYDDHQIIRDNPCLDSLSNLPAIWTTDYWRPAPGGERVLDTYRDRLYRPLTLTTYALNVAIHGKTPTGFLAVNIALHALVSVLVLLVIRRLVNDDAIAAIAALLFAVHPVHTEAVANTVGRAELLSAGFVLAGALLVLAHHAKRSVWRELAAALAFLAALTSKETAVCYPGVVFAAMLLNRSQEARGRLLRLAGVLCLPLLLYFPLRYSALDGYLIRAEAPAVYMNPLVGASLIERVNGALMIAGWNLRLLLLPITYSSDYNYQVIDPTRFDRYTLLGVISLATSIALLTGFRSADRTRRLAAGLALMFLATYALISNTVLLIGVAAADRLLYLPSAPALALIGLGVVTAWRALAANVEPRARRLMLTLGAALLLALAARSAARSTLWSDDLELFQTDVAAFPKSVKLHLNVAGTAMNRLAALADTADPDQAPEREQLMTLADHHAAAALSLFYNADRAIYWRAQIAFMRGDIERATEYARLALAGRPREEAFRVLLAQLTGEPTSAAELETLANQVQAQPQDPNARLAYGQALLAAGRPREAADVLRVAAELAPNEPDLHRALAWALLAADQREAAQQVLTRVLDLNPSDWNAHLNLATLLREDSPQSSLIHATEALRLKPAALETQTIYAEALAANGRLTEAIDYLERVAATLDDDHAWRIAILRRLEDWRAGRP